MRSRVYPTAPGFSSVRRQQQEPLGEPEEEEDSLEKPPSSSPPEVSNGYEEASESKPELANTDQLQRQTTQRLQELLRRNQRRPTQPTTQEVGSSLASSYLEFSSDIEENPFLSIPKGNPKKQPKKNLKPTQYPKGQPKEGFGGNYIPQTNNPFRSFQQRQPTTNPEDKGQDPENDRVLREQKGEEPRGTPEETRVTQLMDSRQAKADQLAELVEKPKVPRAQLVSPRVPGALVGYLEELAEMYNRAQPVERLRIAQGTDGPVPVWAANNSTTWSKFLEAANQLLSAVSQLRVHDREVAERAAQAPSYVVATLYDPAAPLYPEGAKRTTHKYKHRGELNDLPRWVSLCFWRLVSCIYENLEANNQLDKALGGVDLSFDYEEDLGGFPLFVVSSNLPLSSSVLLGLLPLSGGLSWLSQHLANFNETIAFEVSLRELTPGVWVNTEGITPEWVSRLPEGFVGGSLGSYLWDYYQGNQLLTHGDVVNLRELSLNDWLTNLSYLYNETNYLLCGIVGYYVNIEDAKAHTEEGEKLRELLENEILCPEG